MRPLDKRKPAVVATTGSQKIGNARANSRDEDSPNPRELQACRIRNRFSVSWPIAVVVAELHYGGTA